MKAPKLHPKTKSAILRPSPCSLSTFFAEITIVNFLGSEVARLFSGELAAGEHRFTWEPTGLPDGLYECLVRLNGRMETLPIMLLRYDAALAWASVIINRVEAALVRNPRTR